MRINASKKARAHWQSKSICGKRTWKRDSYSRHLPQEAWLGGARGCLRSGGLAAVVIGDGEGIDALASTAAAAQAVGLEVAATATIESHRPAGLRAEGNRRTEHALLLRAP